MVVEAASSEQTLSVSFVRPWHMSECPGLEYCWPPATEAVTVLGKIHIYLILKIKNAIWEIKRDTFFTNIMGPPFHGTRCASDSDASSYWREHWLFTGLIYIAFLVGT